MIRNFHAVTRRSRSKWPDIAQDAVDHITQRLMDTGMDKEQAEDVAYIAIDAFTRAAGGQAVYIPGLCLIRIEERNLLIQKGFNGTNHSELARKHGISTPHVYRILKKQKLDTP